MYVQKESLSRGSRKLTGAHEKVCDENERKMKKNEGRFKKDFIERKEIERSHMKMAERISVKLGLWILHTLKVLIL